MAPLVTDRVEVNGGELEFDVAGEGSAVVLLHPGLWDRRTWDDQIETFAERYRVVRFDARGYGRSSRIRVGEAYSPVEDLAGVMDAAGVGTAALVGCSMGGETALDFALEHPERVEALVLAASGVGGFDDTTPEEEAEFDRLFEGADEALAAGDLERAQDIRLRIWAPLGTAEGPGRRIREIAMDNLDDLTQDGSGIRSISPPAIERLEDVGAPTLVLPADHDPMAMRRVSAILAERIPGARVVHIQDTDHVINLRRPAEFDDAVLGFLAEVL